MNYNLIAYLVYGVLSYYITVRVGWIFYRNGIHFIREELQDFALADSVNNLLLACYYLCNLGYVTLMIWFWEPVATFIDLLECVCTKTGAIVICLGCLHFMNMSVIYLLRKRKQGTIP